MAANAVFPHSNSNPKPEGGAPSSPGSLRRRKTVYVSHRRRALVPLFGLLLAGCGGPDAPGAGIAVETSESPADAVVESGDSEGGSGSASLGTIEATVDGEALTWYVVSGTLDGQPYASGMWMGEAGERVIVAGGFDTPNPPLDTFERDANGMPVSYGDYQGPVMTINLSEAVGPASLRFPSDQIGSGAGASYQRRATLENIIDATYWLAEGVMDVTSLAIEDGSARMEGTFSGTFSSTGTGESVRVTDGRFAIRGLPNVAELMP